MFSKSPTTKDLPPHCSSDVVTSRCNTPNSSVTSLSELSTVAVTDGHRGTFSHHIFHGNPVETERADRIARLAGLGAARNIPTSGLVSQQQQYLQQQIPSHSQQSQSPYHYYPQQQQYFVSAPTGSYIADDANPSAQMERERSTVGGTTFASLSDVFEGGKTNMEQGEDEESDSTDGISDEGTTSLVGFGEGAHTPARSHSSYRSPGNTVNSAAGNVASVSAQTPASLNPYMKEQQQQQQQLQKQLPAQDIPAADKFDLSPLQG